MQTMYSIYFLAIAVFVCGVASIDLYTDQCPWIKGCKCLNSINKLAKKQLIVSCFNSEDPDLDLIPSVNVWTISVVRCRIYNASVLNYLSQTKAIRILIGSNEFPNENELHFNWQWIPETTTNLSLSNNGFRGFRDGNKTGKDCNITRFPKRFSFSASEEKFSGIPSCLPNTTHWMNLKKLPKHSQQESTIWPPGLSILKISDGGFGNYSYNIFNNAPPTLRVVWIINENLSNGSWPAGLPASALNHLLLMHSQLSFVPKGELEKIGRENKLQVLHLGYNELTDIPSNMPSSLQILRMNHNKVQYITASRWSTMTNLRTLDLSFNKLTSVPLKLPTSLKQIELQSNLISYSDRTAFTHLKNLNFLNLDRNKLTTLPRGIQPGIMTYIVGENRISHVRDPTEYEFCTNCTHLTLHGNPWQCDLKMIMMMKWLIDHDVGIYRFNFMSTVEGIKTECKETDLTGITARDGQSRIEIAIKYMSYFEQPPNEKCLYELKDLKCQNAGLKAIPNLIPPGLRKIFITDNKELLNIPDYAFEDQQRLISLNLDNNSLTHLPYGLPKTLKYLNLRYNNIGKWNEQDFEALLNLTSLKAIYMEDNNIKILYDWQFEGLHDLIWIGLSGNPLQCHCSMESFSVFFTKLSPKDQMSAGRSYPICAVPKERKGQDIRDLTGYYRYSDCNPKMCSWKGNIMNCSKEEQTDTKNIFSSEISFQPGRSVILKASSYWRTLDLTGLGLQTHQIDYRNLTQLRKIILTDNLLKQVPVKGLPSSIQVVNLTRNKITRLPMHKEISTHLPNIEVLDLSYNRIKVITAEVNNLEVIHSVFLEGNPLKCECESSPLIQWMHVNKENREIIERHKLQTLSCTTEGNDEIYNIMKIKEEEYCQYFPVAGIVSGVVIGVFFTLLGIFLLNFYAQKKREQKVKEQILLGFQGLLEKEREEGDPETGIGMEKSYKFDAFVSYDPNSSTDAEFVISLLEELEDKRGYTLCLNERDFIPGAGITDNIVECIGESKHIILILSHSFATSPWCQYEVQVSLAELHRRRKSQFIISLLLEDTCYGADMTRNIQTFLSLVTAIEVPKCGQSHDKEWKEFWERLVQMMPPFQPIDMHTSL